MISEILGIVIIIVLLILFIYLNPILFLSFIIILLLPYISNYIEKINDNIVEDNLKLDEITSTDITPDNITNMNNDDKIVEPRNTKSYRSFRNLKTVEIIDEDDFEIIEMINYQKFKKLIDDDIFITKFKKSIIVNLRYKKRKYTELYNDYSKNKKIFDVKTMTAGSTGTENISVIKNAINIIQGIILEINKKISMIENDDNNKIKENLKDAIFNKTNGLESLYGRTDVKDFISLRLYSFSNNPRIIQDGFFNIPIYAPSGAGKTKLASVIGHVFKKSGLLVYGDVISATKKILVSPYVNESTNKTFMTFISSLERILFIDEAYNLVTTNTYVDTADHGTEAIAELINCMDKMIGLNIIIMTGYRKDMEKFMESNEGLKRRFLDPIILKPYTTKELTNILIRFLQEEISIEQEQANYIFTQLEQYKDLFTKEAGDMLNLSKDILTIINSSTCNWDSDYHKVLNKVFTDKDNYIKSNKIKNDENKGSLTPLLQFLKTD